MISLYNDFKNFAINHPKDRACYYRGRFYNYHFLLKHIDSLANYLKQEMHLHETAKISLCLKNNLFSLMMIYACNKVGIILNLINPNLPADQILFFDLTIKSRILFIDKGVYLENPSIYKNIKNKVALIDKDSRSISNTFKYLKNSKEIKVGVPFKYKNKSYELDIENKDIDLSKSIALTAPNEKFDETPYIACVRNDALISAREYQSEIYKQYNNKDMILSDTSMMSIPLFTSFYHTPLTSGVCIYLANLNSDKSFEKHVKKGKITLFSGDISTYRRLFGLKQKQQIQFIRSVKSAYIYNDTQRTYCFDIWKEKCRYAIKDVPLISLLGSVETLGVFAANINDDINPACYGVLLSGYNPCISLKDKKTQIGRLYIKTLATIEGYYKQPDLTDLMFDLDKGILTEFEGGIDINKKLYLSSSKYNKIPYNHNSPYLVNIKDMLMTIPGIKDIDVSVQINMNDLMEFTVDADNAETNRITQEVTSYLDGQLKNKNINYKINFKE